MKKSYIVLILIGLLLFIGYSNIKSTYNTMVVMQEETTGQWANVETSYQRRADLIPNLVKTVQGYADFEKETLTAVIEARSKATSVQIDPTNLNEAQIGKFQAAQDNLGGALSRLLVSVERYPELKANQSFLGLQSQLEGTENRISVERRKFNGSVKAYNTYIKTFPKNIYAGFFDFEKMGYFLAAEGSENVPEVNFD